MQYLFRHFVVLTGFILVLGATSGVGQIAPSEILANPSSLDQRILDEWQTHPSVWIIPRDRALGQESPFGGPCTEAVSLGYSQAFTGNLDPFDCPFDASRTADLYLFNGIQGEQVRVEINSTQFATYGGVFDAFGFEYEGGGAGGPLTILTPTLPTTGEYLIVVTSYNLFGQGNYTVKVDHIPPCTYQVSPVSVDMPPLGGSQLLNVTTQPECYWTAISNTRPRIRLLDDGSMINGDGVIRRRGSGTVVFASDLNDSGNTVTGSLTVAGQNVSVSQTALQCSYSLSQSSFSISGARQTFQLDLITQQGCPWARFANENWFGGIEQPPNGHPVRGPMTLTYLANSNSGHSPRVGTATIAGLTLTVSQAGLNCSYSVSSQEIHVPAENPTGSFRVTTQDFCTFGINGGPNYYLVQFGVPAPYGSMDVTYTFQRNYEAQPRTVNARLIGANGTVSIPITFIQAGAASFPKTLTGRVTSPTGSPLRNITVVLTDLDGNKRTTTTSSFGLYSFEVMTGYSHIISASSRRYRFASQHVFVRSDTAPINLLALE